MYTKEVLVSHVSFKHWPYAALLAALARLWWLSYMQCLQNLTILVHSMGHVLLQIVRCSRKGLELGQLKHVEVGSLSTLSLLWLHLFSLAGGKAFGQLKQKQEEALDEMNQVCEIVLTLSSSLFPLGIFIQICLCTVVIHAAIPDQWGLWWCRGPRGKVGILQK